MTHRRSDSLEALANAVIGLLIDTPRQAPVQEKLI